MIRDMLNDFLNFLIEKNYIILSKNHKEIIDEYLNEEEVIE